jgi:hypothetical protein
MPNWQEALAAIQGIKRLLRFDAGFVQWFDRSPKGAMRSFGLAVPLLPFFLFFSFYDEILVPDIGAFRLIGAAAVGYLLAWIMFPLLLIVIGRAIDREGQAIGAITFYNWYGSAFSMIMLLPYLLTVEGMLGGAGPLIINLLVLASLVFEVFALRVLMGVGYGGAILLTVLDFILSVSLKILLLQPLFQPPAV